MELFPLEIRENRMLHNIVLTIVLQKGTRQETVIVGYVVRS
jgi:hypothetical protein